MIKILDCKNKKYFSKINKFLLKRKLVSSANQNLVDKIIQDIKKKGDKELIKYEKKYSKNREIFTNNKKILKSVKLLDPKVKKAIDYSIKRIFNFHKRQKIQNIFYKDKLRNKLYYKYKPISSVAIYVPGGNASFPSTVLMNAIPAKIAGVKRIVMINPKRNGKQSPAVLYAAKKLGIKEMYSIGGVQAIAALAYGTKKIQKVDKIVGPGNIFVSSAKKAVFGDVGIDMIAGPSEILIVADDKNDPEHIAIDLLSQAEHDKLAQSILITNNYEFAKDVLKNVKRVLKILSRKEIAQDSWNNYGVVIVSKSINSAVEMANELGSPSDMGSAALNWYERGLAAGHGDLDRSGIVLTEDPALLDG